MLGADIRARWIAGLCSATLLTSAGCARSHLEPQVTTTVVRLEADSVPLERAADVTLFKVTMLVRNDGHVPVVFGGCGPEAQRNIDGRWQTVWTPICLSMQYASIAPGDSLSIPVSVAAFTTPGMYPQIDPRMVAGSYRLRFGISYGDTGGPTSSRTLQPLDSPTFRVY